MISDIRQGQVIQNVFNCSDNSNFVGIKINKTESLKGLSNANMDEKCLLNN